MNITRQFVLYFVFGCVQFAVDTALLVMFTIAELSIAVANPMARALAAVLGLMLNYSVTFRRGRVGSIGATTMFRYLTLWVSLTLASTLLIQLLYEFRPHAVDRFQWVAAGKFAVELVLFLASFLISRQWVYRTPPSR